MERIQNWTARAGVYFDLDVTVKAKNVHDATEKIKAEVDTFRRDFYDQETKVVGTDVLGISEPTVE